MKLDFDDIKRIVKEVEQQEVEFLKRKLQKKQEVELDAYYNYLLNEDAGDRD